MTLTQIGKYLIFLFFLLLIIYMSRYLRPRERLVGGLRPWTGTREYTEVYDCLGIDYDFCPQWADYGCDYYCFGELRNKRCFIEEYKEGEGKVRKPTNCRQ